MFLLETSIPFVNFLLCSIILFLGIFYYRKNKNYLVLFTAITYGLFGVSHFITLTEIKFPGIIAILTIIRILGFTILTATLFRLLTKKLYPCLLSILSMYFLSVVILLIPAFKNIANISLLNLIFSTQIIFLAFIVYKKSSNKFAFYISISYLLFSFAHCASVFGFQEKLTVALIVIRLIAYLIVIYALLSFIKKEISSFLLNYMSNIKMQTFLIICSIILLIILFYFPHTKFNCSDPKPQIYPIKPSTSEKQITEIKTGLYVKNFSLFDITTNDFIIDAILWFEFDPHSISLEAIKKFSFEKGTIISLSDPETKIINDRLFTRYKISVKFKSDLNYNLFPLEDHRINIVLTNTFLNPEEVVLKSQNSDLTTKDLIFTGDWIMIGSSVEYGYLKSEITKYEPQKTSLYPTVLFFLDFKKAGIKKSIIIFVPLFIAFFLSLFSLVISISNISGILSLSVGSVTSLIIDLFTLDRMTPNVRYFCLSDIIFNLLLFFVFIIFLLNMYLIKQIKNGRATKNLTEIRNYAFLIFIIIVPLIMYYLLY